MVALCSADSPAGPLKPISTTSVRIFSPSVIRSRFELNGRTFALSPQSPPKTGPERAFARPSSRAPTLHRVRRSRPQSTRVAHARERALENRRLDHFAMIGAPDQPAVALLEWRPNGSAMPAQTSNSSLLRSTKKPAPRERRRLLLNSF